MRNRLRTPLGLLFAFCALALPATAPADGGQPVAKRIAYETSSQTANRTFIWSANIDGSGAVPLATGGIAAKISPDGTTVAYTVLRKVKLRVKARKRGKRKRRTKSVTRFDTYTVPAIGGVARKLAGLPEAKTSAKTLSLADSQSELFSALDGGRASWSPDSKLLAINAIDGSQTGITVVDVSTGNARKFPVGRAGPVDFSPDGGSLVYATGNGRLFTLDLASATPRQIAPAVAPSGQALWGPNSIAAIGANGTRAGFVSPGGQALRFFKVADAFLLEPIGWMPDGSALIVMRLSIGRDGNLAGAVLAIDPNSGASRVLRDLKFELKFGSNRISAVLTLPLALSEDGSALLATRSSFVVAATSKGEPSFGFDSQLQRISLLTQDPPVTLVGSADQGDWNL